ncbi:basic proline-rich protein-like [Plectropomus leopardus]|uniref:basic proline-rich protein-like n=1 Tax=Plectropomus leopardus TaxID=160734 RepID=UPI001C4B2186|nr:basic proline-rich protein-like [Plectropomus leopardus]
MLSADSSPEPISTGAVLVRATRGPGPGPGPGPRARSVLIRVQKLWEPPPPPPPGPPPLGPPPPVEQQRSSGPQRRQQQRHKPEDGAPRRAAGLRQSDGLKKPGRTEENGEPRGRSPAAAESSPDRKLFEGTHRDLQPSETINQSINNP